MQHLGVITTSKRTRREVPDNPDTHSYSFAMIRIKDFETAIYGWKKIGLKIENTATGEIVPLEIDTPQGTYVGGHLPESFRYKILGRIRLLTLKKWPTSRFDKDLIMSELIRLDY